MKKTMCAVCEEDGFMAKGTDKKELASILKTHVKKKHKMDMKSLEAEKMIKKC